MKYIIIDESFPVVFSDATKHSDLLPLGNITSAGFCSFSVNEKGDVRASTWGESVSLGVKSKEGDLFFLEALFRR